MAYDGLITETVRFRGHNGDLTEVTTPAPPSPAACPVCSCCTTSLGWDEWTTEVRASSPTMALRRSRPTCSSASARDPPTTLPARARPQGGASDAEVIGDSVGAISYLREQANASGKIGVIGFLLRRSPHYLAACTIPTSTPRSTAGRRRGGERPSALTPKRPVAPIDLTATMTAPLLGIFGNDDMAPSRADVDKTEAKLKELGKTYEFHRYDGAGHGFFNVPAPAYRPQQATDAWNKVLAFYQKNLGAPSTAGAR